MPHEHRAPNAPSRCSAMLVIGVHREQLAFGDRVAAELNLSSVHVLRIPEGLSGRHPRQDQLFYYETLHRELYHQLLVQIRGRFSMMLDLHCGLDERGPCADLISRDPLLLDCVRNCAATRYGRIEGDRILRPVLLDKSCIPDSATIATHARPIIPSEFWNDSMFHYVGIEIYLPWPGDGDAHSWELACWLIKMVVACARIDRQDGNAGMRPRARQR